jgi:hypothetical protein
MTQYNVFFFQLNYHPGHDDLVQHVIAQAFKHFKYRDK